MKFLKKSIILYNINPFLLPTLSILIQAFSPTINEFIRAKGWLNFELARISHDYCEDYTKKAINGDFPEIIGRDTELNRITTILSQNDNKANVLLIGEPGVGKTSLAQELACRIAQNKIPELKDEKLINVDFIGLIAGKNQDNSPFQPTQRVRALLNYAKKNNVILFIDEFHQVGNAVELFKTAIDSGKIKILAATTTDEYNKYIKPNEALDRRFEKVVINELSPEDTLPIVKNLAEKISKKENIIIPENIPKIIVNFCEKYIKNRCFPCKAVEILKLSAKICSCKNKNRVITETDIRKIISDETGIPLFNFDNLIYIDNLKSRLKKKVFGQNKAIDKVCEGITLLQSNFRPKNFIVNFLFIGPNSVGKNYLATTLGEEIGSLIEVDMSLYSEPGSSADFLDNKLNYNIFKDIIQKPYSVILFKNIEKASIDVQELIVNAFHNGYFTNKFNKKIDISNAILIATTDVCENIFKTQCGCRDCRNSYLATSMKKIAENVNYLVNFNKLTCEDLENIIDLTINEFSKKLKDNNINLIFETELKKYLAKKCENSKNQSESILKEIVKNIIIPTIELISKIPYSGDKINILCSEESDKITIKQQ